MKMILISIWTFGIVMIMLLLLTGHAGFATKIINYHFFVILISAFVIVLSQKS